MVCIYGIAAILPFNLQKLIDEGIYWHNKKVIGTCILVYALCFLGYVIFQSIYSYVWQRLSNSFSVDIKKDVFRKILFMNAKERATRDTGDLMHRIDWDGDQFIHMVMRNLFHFINSFFFILSLLIIVGSINITMALLLCVAAVLPILMTRMITKRSKKHYEQARIEKGHLIQCISESLMGFLCVRFAGAESVREKKIEKQTKSYIKSENNVKIVELTLDKMVYAVNLLTSIGIYLYAIYLIHSEQFTIGYFLAVIEYIALMHKKLNWMLKLSLDFSTRKMSVKRVIELLQSKEETSGKEELSQINGIQCRNLSFQYDGKEVLKNCNVKIEKGEKIAVVGKSGAGKTTFVSLLTGLLNGYSGDIMFNNVPIDSYSKESLRKHIGVAIQDGEILNGSIRDFLQLGNRHYSEDEITQVLKQTGLLSVIEKFPDGINERIEAENKKLSGGQLQRLHIVRLLLRNPQIYLLDETTSGLDKETEGQIYHELFQEVKDSILIVITHRKEYLEYFDRVIEIEEGRMKSWHCTEAL
ncbi:MAG: ABC transporter ATP-binding protein/permease [Lachnoclostridium sp.]|jgi:ABC-type multidrug transport system fused ATPase/permease subunit|nr:ABC transporter ATP-binding protein/permease [Lachnoclostridium sp.]